MAKSIVAVYENNDKALRAVKHLANHDIGSDKLSVIGRGDIVEDHIHVVPVKKMKQAPIFIGAGFGAVAGIMAGVLNIPIPGVKFLTEAGGLPGFLGGMTIGLVVGALTSIAISAIYRKDDLILFKKHLEGGKFLVVVNGSDADIEKSKKLLHTENLHIELHDLIGE